MIELELLVKENDYDIIAITETNFKNSDDDVNFFLPGYTCMTETKGRGVGLYIKQNLEVLKITDFDSIFNPSILCKISKNGQDDLVFGVLYRSPSCSEDENKSLNVFINKVSERYAGAKLCFVGDFNYPNINWADEVCNKACKTSNSFLNTLQHNLLSQHIYEPTHYRALQTQNILDLVITNKDFLSDLNFLPPLGKSHHIIVHFNLFLKESTFSTVATTKYLFGKANFVGMREFVGSYEWEENLKDVKDVDECWSKIKNVLHIAKDKFVPKVKIKPSATRSRRDPVPKPMLDKIREKRRLFKVYKKFPTKLNLDAYARVRNQVKWESRKLVKSKEESLAKEAKNNPKLFYQYVSTKIKPKESVSNLVKDDGSITSSDKEKAEVLNNFFSSVFTQEENDEKLPDFKYGNASQLDTVNITEEKMKKALKNLNVNKSPGPDEISSKILKELADELAWPLTYLFERTVEEGKIPNEWKEAEVKPIFKKGDKACPGNYRPVSLTCIVCKVFEGFIRDCLNDHLIKNGLLADQQFGFSKGRSCVTQLLTTIHDWLSEIDEDKSVDAVYLDLRKAFDTVPHKRLLHKLDGYGVKGKVLSWISSFLTDRTQFVTVNGNRSNEIDVTSGVPQGSVLGPTLFIYFINDLPTIVDCSVKIFADDTKLYDVVDDTEKSKNKIQSCINALVGWANKWLIQFNREKCKVLHLGSKNPQHVYHMGCDEQHRLDETVAEKDLGVIVDPDLSFDKHINETVKKGNKLTGMLSRVITNKSKDIMVPLYKSLVRPVLEYGNSVWSPSLRRQIDHLEGVQRRFTKRIVGTNNMSYEERLAFLKLPSLEYRRVRGDLIETYKMVHDMYDSTTISSLIKIQGERVTRGHNYKLIKTRTNTQKFHHFFTNRITNLWNNLPNEAVNAKSLNAFKNYIDKLYKECIYSSHLEDYNPLRADEGLRSGRVSPLDPH